MCRCPASLARSTRSWRTEFFQGFANHAFVTLHIDNLRGENFTTRPKLCSGVCPSACMALEIDPRGGRDPIDQVPL
jgi:imidazoleglycerol phosphate dehydratase HisB